MSAIDELKDANNWGMFRWQGTRSLQLEIVPELDAELAALRAENESKKRRNRILEVALAEKTSHDFAVAFNQLAIENAVSTGTINKLRAELDEWENAKKFVADGCTDEIHCGCVPILKRELEAANKAVEDAREILEYVVNDYGINNVLKEDTSAWLAAHPAKEQE